MKCLFIEMPSMPRGDRLPFYDEVLAPARKQIRHHKKGSDVNPSYPTQSPPPVYSLGLLLLASAIAEAGMMADYVVLSSNDILDHDSITTALAARLDGVKVVCLGPTTPQVEQMVRIASTVKRISPNCRIVVGGSHVSAAPDDLLKYQCVDALIVGPGENALVRYCLYACHEAVSSTRSTSSTYANMSPEIIQEDPVQTTPSTTLTAALHLLPSLDFRPYTMCTWGCRFSCRFCAEGARFKKYSYRSPSAIKAELDIISRQFPSSTVHFADSCFPISSVKYLRAIEESDIRGFEVNLRASDDFDDETLKTAVRSGLKSICIGVETVDEVILRSMNKFYSYSALKANLRTARTSGIRTIKAYWLFGYPGETIPSILRSLEKIWELLDEGLIDDVYTKCFVPYPGTFPDKILEEKGGRVYSHEWRNYHRRTFPPVCSYESLTGIELYSAWLLSEAIRTAAISRKQESLNALNDWCMNW